MTQRIIKFRAWDTIDQKMTDVPFAIVNDQRNRDPEYWKPLPWMIVRPNGRQWVGSATSRHIPMQFTGLLDKNGKEIYEGDIVQWQVDVWDDEKDKQSKKKMFAQIKFGEGGIGRESGYVGGGFLGWYLADKDGQQMEDQHGDTCDFVSETLKIIGNIYENPDLLPPHSQKII